MELFTIGLKSKELVSKREGIVTMQLSKMF